MSCNVEGCEEDPLWDGQCDEHLAESYGKENEGLPQIALAADKIHVMLERHGAECIELTDDTPLCLAIAVYLDKHHHLKED